MKKCRYSILIAGVAISAVLTILAWKPLTSFAAGPKALRLWELLQRTDPPSPPHKEIAAPV